MSTDLVADHLASALAAELLRLDAVRVRPDEPFRLASGGSSPIYVDVRRIVGSVATRRLVSAVAGRLVEQRALEVEVVAGGETAGIPFATDLATALAIPLAYVRKKPKGHGAGAQVEGAAVDGRRVLLIEDLVTAGGSLLTFVEGLRRAGAEVVDAIAIFDRRQGGAEAIAAEGVTLHTLCDLDRVLDIGETSGALDAEARAVVEAYRRDPDGWQP